MLHGIARHCQWHAGSALDQSHTKEAMFGDNGFIRLIGLEQYLDCRLTHFVLGLMNRGERRVS
jgi:hypothetical protein